MNDILNFDKMLTPKIITVVYWIMLLGVAIGGLGSMFAGPEGFSISSLFMGVVYAVGGAVAVRIWCELLIVAFKMNEALQEIRHK
jgi:hypothetical protein